MPYKTPTRDDVKRAWDQITEDGPEHDNPRLSLLPITDPILAEVIHRQYQGAVNLGVIAGHLKDHMPGTDGGAALIKSLIAGAVIYGLHLGIHLGRNQILDTISGDPVPGQNENT